jgi:hypothetical protein
MNEAKATPAYSVLFVGGLAVVCWLLLIWMVLEAWSSL